MKSTLVCLLSAVALSACATFGEKSTPAPAGSTDKSIASQLGDVQAKQAALAAATAPAQPTSSPVSPSPSTTAMELSWASFEMMVIQLDKNKKPQKSEKLTFDDKSNLQTFGSMGPKLNLSTFPLGQNMGKVLQVSCATTDLKQKFDSPSLLKGWAVEFNCAKSSYFIIINSK